MKIQAEDFLKIENLAQDTMFFTAIAGGSLRDIILGKEVKDVDLFMLPSHHAHMDLHQPRASLWTSRAGTDNFMVRGAWTTDIYYPVVDVWEKFELHKQGEGESECGEDFSSYLCPDIPGLNVIVLGPTVRTVHGVTNNDRLIKYLFHSFPCNMSRIALNSDGLHVHDSFWDGAKDKQFIYDVTKIRNNYIDRMIEKYPPPEWTHDDEYTATHKEPLHGIKSAPPSMWIPKPKPSLPGKSLFDEWLETASVTPSKSFPY